MLNSKTIFFYLCYKLNFQKFYKFDPSDLCEDLQSELLCFFENPALYAPIIFLFPSCLGENAHLVHRLYHLDRPEEIKKFNNLLEI